MPTSQVPPPAPNLLTLVQVADQASLSPQVPEYVEPVTSGIRNFAVNCYANSALQAFKSIPALVRGVLGLNPDALGVPENQKLFIKSLQSIFYHMYHTPDVRIGEHLIRRLFAGIAALGAGNNQLLRMQLWRHEDGSEFFLSLLQLLDTRILPNHGINLEANYNFSLQGYYTDLPTETFGAVEHFKHSLGITSNWARGNTFNNVLTSNLHDVTSANYAGGGGIHYDRQLSRSPPVLFVNVQRTLSNGGKFCIPLDIPLHLNIAAHMQPNAIGGPHVYDLRSVVVHIGQHSGGGHYISMVRNMNDSTWLEIDDSRKTPISQQQFQSIAYGTSSDCSTASLLVYVKRSARANVMAAITEWPEYVAQNYTQLMQGIPLDLGSDVDSMLTPRYLGGIRRFKKGLVSAKVEKVEKEEEEEEEEEREEEVEKELEKEEEEKVEVGEGWGKGVGGGVEAFFDEEEDPEDFIDIFATELLPRRKVDLKNLPKQPDITVGIKRERVTT